MSLDALLTKGKPSGHKADKVLIAYRSLSEDERAAFGQLIQDPMWSAPQIADALRELGHDIDGDQVRNFRTKLKNGRVYL